MPIPAVLLTVSVELERLPLSRHLPFRYTPRRWHQHVQLTIAQDEPCLDCLQAAEILTAFSASTLGERTLGAGLVGLITFSRRNVPPYLTPIAPSAQRREPARSVRMFPVPSHRHNPDGEFSPVCETAIRPTQSMASGLDQCRALHATAARRFPVAPQIPEMHVRELFRRRASQSRASLQVWLRSPQGY